MSTVSVTASDESEQGEVRSFSLLGALKTFLQHRKKLTIGPLTVGVVTLVLASLKPLQYTSSASIVPQETEESAGSSVFGLAAQLGVNLPQGGLGQSSPFYASLITSRPILEGLVDTTYMIGTGSKRSVESLQDLLAVSPGSSAKRREEAIRIMRSQMRVSMDLKTGIVSYSIRSPWPELSYAAAKRILILINRFNVDTRQTQAKAERDLTQMLLQSAKADLQTAEDSLQFFLQRNRSYAGNPQLALQFDHLNRDLQVRQQVYMSLAQNYEQLRMDAVRNTPMITVIEQPELAVIPERRYLAFKAIGATMAAFLVIAAFLFARTALRSDAEASQDLEDLKRAADEAFRSLRVGQWQPSKKSRL